MFAPLRPALSPSLGLCARCFPGRSPFLPPAQHRALRGSPLSGQPAAGRGTLSTSTSNP